MKKGDVVIYESTVIIRVRRTSSGPGCERISGLKYNATSLLGYSPERIKTPEIKKGNGKLNSGK